MIHAAGILFATADRRALFLRRGEGGDMPGTWATPGGKVEDGETAAQAAVRETLEETGREVDPASIAVLVRTTSQSPGAEAAEGAADPGTPDAVDFTTFVASASEEWVPTLNDEHSGWAWADLESPPEPLHPGVRTALARLNMDELGVARAMMAGELSSPQRYINVTLFCLRITGTGLAYRKSLDEYVWRDPSLYLNDEFVQRCYGLPVIMEHPEGATLDSDEYADRNVGTVVLPYIKNNDVWGVAKIYDDATVEMLSDPDHPLKSTSPTVVLRPGDPYSSRMTLEDGSELLIEGRPALLDHVALCPAGVWDKGGPPTGVAVADSAGADRVTEEERKELEELRADKKRRDSESTSALDGIMRVMDSMGKRMDAMEQADRARKDGVGDGGEVKTGEAARAEALREGMADPVVDSRRKDSESDDDWKSRKDAMRKDADKRRDGESDDDWRSRKDASLKAIKDAEDEDDEDKKKRREREDKARKDAEDEEDKRKEREREDRARKDSERRLSDRMDTFERRLGKPLSDADRALMADAQARADGVYAAFGDAAPRPLEGEDLNAYRRRLAGKLRERCRDDALKGVNVMAIHDAASFDYVEGRIYADAAEAARQPLDVPHGELREVKSRDSTGRVHTEFYGSPRSWLAPHMAEGALVSSINRA